MTKFFKGTGIAIITPFNKDKSIDFDSLEKIIEYNISGGTDFIVVHGTTAEAATQTSEEKKAVREFVLEKVNGRLPLAVGMGGNDTADLIVSLRTIDLTGFDAILSVAPYYNKPTQGGMIAHFEAVADYSPLPVIIYNVPGRTGANIKAETCLKLAAHKNIIAVKEASGNLEQIMEIIRKKPEGFSVLSGDDLLTFPMVALGADGVISVAAQAAPELFSGMVKDALASKNKEAAEKHYRLMPYMQYLFADGNPAGIKAALAARGLCKNILRLPLIPANEQVCTEIEKLIPNL